MAGANGLPMRPGEALTTSIRTNHTLAPINKTQRTATAARCVPEGKGPKKNPTGQESSGV